MKKEWLEILFNWRLIHLLGISNLRLRYARSRLGQAWLTLSLLIQIVSTGAVWSVLWHMPIREFLPYVAVGQTIYQFFVASIQDSTNLFISDARLYVNQYLPFMTSVLANLYKNIVIFLHNIPIIIFALVFSLVPIRGVLEWFIVFPCAVIFLISSSYIIAAACTRYRDLQQVIQSLLNISFLLTPIMWQLHHIPERFLPYFFLNPLTGFLELLRNPLLNMPVSPYALPSVIGWTIFVLLIMNYVHHRYERRIILWV